MIESFNFPVKYAVLELVEDGGYIIITFYFLEKG